MAFLKDQFLELCYFCYMLMTYLTPVICLLFTYLLMTLTSTVHVRTLKNPSQPHLCYWDRITHRTRGKGQRYNLKISTRKTCHDSFAFIHILTSNKRLSLFLANTIDLYFLIVQETLFCFVCERKFALTA